jgi:hypothetical protein
VVITQHTTVAHKARKSTGRWRRREWRRQDRASATARFCICGGTAPTGIGSDCRIMKEVHFIDINDLTTWSPATLTRSLLDFAIVALPSSTRAAHPRSLKLQGSCDGTTKGAWKELNFAVTDGDFIVHTSKTPSRPLAIMAAG